MLRNSRQLNAFAPEWVPGGVAIPAALPRAALSAPEPELCRPQLTGLKVAAVPKAAAGDGDGTQSAAAHNADVAGGGELEFDEVFAPSGAVTPRLSVRFSALSKPRLLAVWASSDDAGLLWLSSDFARPALAWKAAIEHVPTLWVWVCQASLWLFYTNTAKLAQTVAS